MIRDDYKIIKAIVSASCKYYCSYYELNVWFKDSDLESRGSTYNIGMSDIKEKSGVKRGDGFKRVQIFLDTVEGKVWLEKTLQEQDLRVEVDEIKKSIRMTIYNMGLPDLIEFDRLGKELIR
ncbi:hypothetical protein [Clostridium estertheticum]|uniref:hypothetical protein n=1 Tax=Clostridium estertheticum TaxID=238834 RepID=UPI001C0DDFFB|nr:hypothetical protein [Clostridium estertheticum]MBU3186576.1 hypothetical protein [Clostridium estertheticum]